MRLLFLFLILLFCGCNQPTLKLDSKWEPLTQIIEAPHELMVKGMTTTIGDTCYVYDLKEWVKNNPNGSIKQEALLIHEKIHSERQYDHTGSYIFWIIRYVLDSDFQLDEEKRGWGAEITFLIKNGYNINKEVVAYALNKKYRMLTGRMISYADAYRWVTEVVTKATSGS